MMLCLVLLLISWVSAQNTPIDLSQSQILSNTASESGYNYYSVLNPYGETFELDIWRTQTFPYNEAPNLYVTVDDPNNVQLYSGVFYGQQTISGYTNGNYTVSVSLLTGFNTMAYQIRACTFSCSNNQCPYNYGIGYCNANGACVNGICVCDNSTSLTWDTYSCSLNISWGLWENFIGLWIALIIVAFLLVFVLPIIICVCCCGACAAAAAERQPIIHHHHPINPTYATGPVYNTSMPTPGVSYVQAQPAGLYQPGQQWQPQQQVYQPGQPYQPQQQVYQPGQPQAQPQSALYPKNYDKV